MRAGVGVVAIVSGLALSASGVRNRVEDQPRRRHRQLVNYFWRVEYLVPHRGGTQTLFVFRDIFNRAKGKLTGYSVLEVSVRTPYERLPEFAPGWRDQCATGWAESAVPRLNHG